MVELVDAAAERLVVVEVAKALGGLEHEFGGVEAEGFAREEARKQGGAGGVTGVGAPADVERGEGHELSLVWSEQGVLVR